MSSAVLDICFETPTTLALPKYSKVDLGTWDTEAYARVAILAAAMSIPFPTTYAMSGVHHTQGQVKTSSSHTNMSSAVDRRRLYQHKLTAQEHAVFQQAIFYNAEVVSHGRYVEL